MPKSLMQRKSLLPAINSGLSKSQIVTLVRQSVENVLERGNILQMAEVVSVMEYFIRCFRKDESFVDFLRGELLKNQGAIITNSGAKIEICETAITYDYSNNLEWRELDRQISDLESKRKRLEVRLRCIPAGKSIVDLETGEALMGPNKISKSSYKITLSNQ